MTEASTRDIKVAWLSVIVEPLNVLDEPVETSINIDAIVSVRKTDQTTCHIHAQDGVDYHVMESYESVMGKIANEAVISQDAPQQEEDTREHN